ncbi:hypothetical protein BOTNAR_0153g00020 [Botryotinia narcissicola]|uniref:Uncharacterized protein n=1 Tax=Botryotinia narcissicola TaxID=278944 RepID=A0A4Z1IES3_9HELO|nr:hypothetical protein BOTNAR_0153g00020 [Botryotinia narcissicola]
MHYSKLMIIAFIGNATGRAILLENASFPSKRGDDILDYKRNDNGDYKRGEDVADYKRNDYGDYKRNDNGDYKREEDITKRDEAITEALT